MLIQVVYDNGRSGTVKSYLLDRLIEEKKVTRFLRSEGWVVVGRDTLRKKHTSQRYDGPERRDFDSLSASIKWGSITNGLLDFAWIAGLSIIVFIMFSGLL